MNIAVIDLGTNSVRLYIYALTPDRQPELLHSDKQIIRLGDDLFETGDLSDDAMDRTLSAFQFFSESMHKFDVNETFAVATSAVRSGRNSEELLSAITSTTNISLRVISGIEEAELIAEGVSAFYELPDEPTLVVDLGGGSTEVILLQQDTVLQSRSIKMGAARGQQMFLKTVPPSNEAGYGIGELRANVRQLLRDIQPQNIKTVLGSSGSIRALGRIHAAENNSEDSFSLSYLQDLAQRMSPMQKKELLLLPCLEPRRADLILAAALILEEICRYFSIETIRPIQLALKDGLLIRAQRSFERSRT